MSNEKNGILNKKITDLPGWVFVLGVLLFGIPQTIDLLSHGVLNLAPKESKAETVDSKKLAALEKEFPLIKHDIDQLEKTDVLLININEKQTDSIIETSTQLQVQAEKLRAMEKKLDKLEEIQRKSKL